MLKGDLPYTCQTKSPEETHQLACRFADLTAPGNLVLLRGDLGAGKTQFVRGLCDGLGMAELWEVDSPTYTIVNSYGVGAGVDHIDLYRFQNGSELEEIGFEEMLATSSIKVIEWPERLAGYPLPPPDFMIHIHIEGASVRTIHITAPP